jgi:BA14K-like protein
MRFVVAIGASLIFIPHAAATVPEYCAAYARDFADHVKKQDPQWQRRYDNAEAFCLFRFTSESKPPAKTRIKKAAVKTPPPPPLAPVEVAAPEPAPEPAPAKTTKVKPKLVAGSPEWTDYCKKKYVSFNEAKGTYLSKTGKERKCLVTAN